MCSIWANPYSASIRLDRVSLGASSTNEAARWHTGKTSLAPDWCVSPKSSPQMARSPYPSLLGGRASKRGGSLNLTSSDPEPPFGAWKTSARFLKGRGAKMAKRVNTRRIRANRSYTVTEAAKICGVTPWTVRNWIRKGLPVIDDQRPYLITGEALKAFLEARHSNAKCELNDGELYCPCCKGRTRALSGEIEVRTYGKRLAVQGKCARCETICSRFVRASQIPDFAPSALWQSLIPAIPKGTSKPLLKTIQGGRLS